MGMQQLSMTMPQPCKVIKWRQYYKSLERAWVCQYTECHFQKIREVCNKLFVALARAPVCRHQCMVMLMYMQDNFLEDLCYLYRKAKEHRLVSSRSQPCFLSGDNFSEYSSLLSGKEGKHKRDRAD